ncbi:TolB family protein [Kordia sp.]|uniref:TolB family protein n=1 Tax=Kordia sp. TaxID=1965332 RepID=UPI003D2A1C17
MKKLLLILLLMTVFMSCENKAENSNVKFLVNKVPNNIPIDFMQQLVPENQLIHKGIFSPNLDEYYYVISDQNFEQFNIYVIKKHNGKWSEPESAFINSTYNEHGMSFSPDGNSLYFSSTRPTSIAGMPQTWHIWKTDKVNGKWGTPVFVDIPNLRNKLVSHPTITNSGTLYFHVSNLDYSKMDIYHAALINGNYSNAEKTAITGSSKAGNCTPYVSPKEDYLIFAAIGDSLELMISFSDGNGGWENTKKLNTNINTNGQGNPYVTPDNAFLFFTTGNSETKWSVKWVAIESELKK